MARPFVHLDSLSCSFVLQHGDETVWESAMGTGRPCVICSDSEKTKLVTTMVAEGASDQAIADRLGGIHRMAVSRHRRNHIEAPARAIVEAAAKGRDAVEERAQVGRNLYGDFRVKRISWGSS
jgi:hypothetical protein